MIINHIGSLLSGALKLLTQLKVETEKNPTCLTSTKDLCDFDVL